MMFIRITIAGFISLAWIVMIIAATETYEKGEDAVDIIEMLDGVDQNLSLKFSNISEEAKNPYMGKFAENIAIGVGKIAIAFGFFGAWFGVEYNWIIGHYSFFFAILLIGLLIGWMLTLIFKIDVVQIVWTKVKGGEMNGRRSLYRRSRS